MQMLSRGPDTVVQGHKVHCPPAMSSMSYFPQFGHQIQTSLLETCITKEKILQLIIATCMHRKGGGAMTFFRHTPLAHACNCLE